MYHIAVVDDEAAFITQIKGFLKKYQAEQGTQVKVSAFGDGAGILEGYRPIYDIILLDIDMPKVNGMAAAERIREQDTDVVLVFITNMAGYAIQGYSVGALDFVMKPLDYYTFSLKLARAIKRVGQRRKEQILLTLPDGARKIELSQIYYIEVQNRYLTYHTAEGDFSVKGTMTNLESQFMNYPFAKCNHWYLVNLMHVKEIRKNTAVVAGDELEISRRNKASFLKALTEYMGGSI